MAGDPENGIAPLEWKGDDAAKVRSLIQSFLSTLHAKYSGIKSARYDFGTGQFLDRREVPILWGSEQDFDKAAKSPRGRESRAGQATLRRGIFLQSLVSGDGGEKSDLLGDLLHRGNQLTDSGLGGLFAAPLPEPETTGDMFKKRVKVDQALVDEAKNQQKAFGQNVSSGKRSRVAVQGVAGGLQGGVLGLRFNCRVDSSGIASLNV